MHFLFSWFFLYLALQCVCWVVLLHKEAHGHGEEGEDGHGDSEEEEEATQELKNYKIFPFFENCKPKEARVESPPARYKSLVCVDDDEEAKKEVLVDDLGGDVDDVLELDETGTLPSLQLLPLCQVTPLPLVQQFVKVIDFGKFDYF